MKHRVRENIVVLFIAGVLALNYPLLSSADRLLLPLGIPLLYLYIFLVWLAIIVLMALIVERKDLHSDEKAESRDA
jgi:hypothetical protein